MTATATDATRSAGLTGSDRVAILAGSGSLPLNVAESLRQQGHAPFVIMIEGEATNPSLLQFDHIAMPLEAFGSLRRTLKQHRITHVVMAGGIGRRPRLSALKPSLGLLAALPRLARGLRRGDDGVLRVIIQHLEAVGLKVVGPHEIVPDIVAIEGPMTATVPLADDWRDLNAAKEAALAIGALDIGQAAISINGRVVALEGIEGTDGLLARTRDLRSHGRIAGLRRGVLVKCAKPAQELRADLPGIGPRTVEDAHAAGLAGIGVEAGRALILDWAELVKRADALGIFVVGLPQGLPK